MIYEIALVFDIYQPLKLLRYRASVIAESTKRTPRRHCPFAFVSPRDLDLETFIN